MAADPTAQTQELRTVERPGVLCKVACTSVGMPDWRGPVTRGTGYHWAKACRCVRGLTLI